MREPADQGAHLRRYWAAVKRYWWLIVGLTALGTAAGVIGTRFVDPVYMAQGGMLLADIVPQGGGGGGAFRNPALLPIGAWVELFKTYTVVEEVVARQRLWYRPRTWQDSVALEGIRPTASTTGGSYTYTLDTDKHYTLTEAKKGVVEHGVLGDTVGRSVGFVWVPTLNGLMGRHSVSFYTRTLRPIAEELRNGIEIKMQDNSNLVRPVFSWSNPRQASDILNTWMQTYIDQAAKLRSASLSDNADRLEAQRAAALNQVHAAQTALQDYRTNTITQPSEGSSASAAMSGSGRDYLSSDYIQAQHTLESLRNDRAALEALAAHPDSMSLDGFVAIPSAMQFPRLMAAVGDAVKRESDLRTLYQQGMLDSLPSVRDAKAALQDLLTRVIPSLATDAARVLRSRENQILKSMEADSLRLRTIPAQSIREAELRRDLSVAENQYLRVDNEYETRQLAAMSSLPDVSIIDRAVSIPQPTIKIILALVVGGVMGSLFLGIMLALLLDFTDHRFRYPEQVTHDLGLDVIGALPSVPEPSRASKDPEALLQSVEAFRGLRMNVHHAFDVPPITLTITSPGAGDGKSMVASNLALSFAEAGYRTLLIDGDVRRGKLHSVFNVERRPGLLDYLACAADLRTVMRNAPMHDRLKIITSGTRRHHAPELLTSARLPALLDSVRSDFDVILIDSAPLGAGVDAYALGAATGSMLVVMRTGLTDRRVAKAKLKLAERLAIRVIGAVINVVPASGLYSEYAYLHGYETENEDEVGQPAEVVATLRPGDALHSDAVQS